VRQWLADERSWSARVWPALPQQQVAAWAAAVSAVLANEQHYRAVSARSRAVAAGVLGGADAQMRAFVDWLALRCGGG
jgi:hypothetical protein